MKKGYEHILSAWTVPDADDHWGKVYVEVFKMENKIPTALVMEGF